MTLANQATDGQVLDSELPREYNPRSYTSEELLISFAQGSVRRG
ncbi:hypothetical protein HNR07_005695 [Nocardiopsis metallicus]|uniref:Uncharacterized protein n=1 Tax=Nocardiopsis metallicus TaxID=179819 RepID=A0A840WWK7_9ACTN|nr:hypothetical protein [Nocardiopsis metallicus]